MFLWWCAFLVAVFVVKRFAVYAAIRRVSGCISFDEERSLLFHFLGLSPLTASHLSVIAFVGFGSGTSDYVVEPWACVHL